MPSSKNYVRCPVCDSEFQQKRDNHRFCSDTCKGKFKYQCNKVTTETQYTNISGNWDRYLSRLLYFSGRKRDLLSKDILMNKLKSQDFKCALSGIQMTCNLEKGKDFPFNVSVDRIIAGGPYSEDNIQLVCKSLNSWRSDTSVEDFIFICTKVAEYNKEKQVALVA